MLKILFKSLLAIAVYLGIHYTANLEPVKETFDDFAYDKMAIDGINLFDEYIGSLLPQKPLPKVNVLLIDDRYLDENNLSRYGYVYPRKEMADILSMLNMVASDAAKPLKAVFIDYDFEYTEMPYGHTLSAGDKEFLKAVLNFDKRTAILLPRTGEFSFIEHYIEENNVTADNIIFVSPRLLKSDDLLVRRIEPYIEVNDKIYPNVALALFMMYEHNCTHQALSSMKKLNDEQARLCGFDIDAFDVTKDRIATKLFYTYEENPYNLGYLFWDEEGKVQKIKSVANLMEDAILPNVLADSIVIIGSSNENNGDYLEVPYSIAFDPIRVPGVLIHLSALNTLVHQSGLLQRFNPVYGSMIVFVLFFFFAYVQEKHKGNRIIEFFVSAFTMSILFFIISFFIYVYDQTWFNWFSPLVTYQLLDILDVFLSIKLKLAKILPSHKKADQ